jgi:hypothetical protein
VLLSTESHDKATVVMLTGEAMCRYDDATTTTTERNGAMIGEVIGEVIQHILDKGFFVRFTYDIQDCYRLRAWKYYNDDMCTCEWEVSDFSVSQSIVKEVSIMEADRYLKQVDDNIAQRRLIDSALR